MPFETSESPVTAKTATPASTRYLRRVTTRSCLERRRRGGGLVCLAPVSYPPVAHGPGLKESLGLLVEALAFDPVERTFFQDADYRLGAEIVFVVEAMNEIQN